MDGSAEHGIRSSVLLIKFSIAASVGFLSAVCPATGHFGVNVLTPLCKHEKDLCLFVKMCCWSFEPMQVEFFTESED